MSEFRPRLLLCIVAVLALIGTLACKRASPAELS